MKKILTVILTTFSLMLLMTSNYKAIDFPTAKISDLHIDEDSIAVTYDLIDTSDDVLMHTDEFYSNITLNKDGQVLEEIKISEGTSNRVEFTDLSPNTEYTININAPYDLLANDEPYNEAPYTILTQDTHTYKRQPTGEILSNSKSSFNSIFVDTEIIDIDSAIIDTPRLELVRNDQVIESVYLQDTFYTFDDLEFNEEYTVNLFASYDIDSNSVSEGELLLSTKNFVTGDYYKAPTVAFNQPTITNTSLLVDYNLIDKDNTLLPNKSRIVLKQGQEVILIEIPSIGMNQTQLFEGLSSGEYTVEITGQYDIDDDGIADNESPYILGSANYTVGPLVPSTETLE